MNREAKFEVRFDPGAYQEYLKLDGSLVGMIDKKLEELEFRADEIGKRLRNTHSSKLAGCREIKLRDAGIRIVYRIVGEKVDVLRIVYILTIRKRADEYVFQVADNRASSLKRLTSDSLSDHIESLPFKKKK